VSKSTTQERKEKEGRKGDTQEGRGGSTTGHRPDFMPLPSSIPMCSERKGRKKKKKYFQEGGKEDVPSFLCPFAEYHQLSRTGVGDE